MLRAMSTAASGMEAQEMRMDVIANNLANVNTTGFKKSRAEFQDLLYDNLRLAGATAADGTQAPTGAQVGQGVRPVATLRQHTMGDLKQTGNALDLAIEGAGFFQVRQPDGQFAYTRDGALKVDGEGRLVNADGLLLEPGLVVPADAREITVAADGTFSIVRGNDNDAVDIGRIELVLFSNPAGLQAIGRNLLVATPAAGVPMTVLPGSEGAGRLAQGRLELSNVKVIEEMIDLIATQRAYETNSKVIQAVDEMLRSTSNLR